MKEVPFVGFYCNMWSDFLENALRMSGTVRHGKWHILHLMLCFCNHIIILLCFIQLPSGLKNGAWHTVQYILKDILGLHLIDHQCTVI